MEKFPRIVIGACQGRSGKTTITLGLLKALKDKGLKVQAFKRGPDYIDPSWHTFASGSVSRNLDAFMMDKTDLVNSFIDHAEDADISIVEGAMGLFDGLDLEGSGSTAQIAYLIDAPVILVVNCQRMTRSVAALINGVVDFDSRINVAGVILNNVARKRHHHILKDVIGKYCKIPIVGIIPRNTDIVIPDRHLGLIPAGEQDELKEKVDKLGQLIAENVDLDMLMKIAENSNPLDTSTKSKKNKKDKKVKIGVIKDRVFSFYYPENLESLEDEGAELIYIDSLNDNCLPKVDALYIGGGFPEVFAEELEKNSGLRGDIKKSIETGLPVYAECGGLMYLGRKVFLKDGNYEMVGALPYDVKMEEKPQGHGYTINRVSKNHPFLDEGVEVKGHEFHNSKLINLDEKKVDFGFSVERGKGITGKQDGIVYKNCFAAYSHTHVLAFSNWAESFVNKALEHKNRR